MTGQSRRIAGSRRLEQSEIDLINKIKAAEAELLAVHQQVLTKLRLDYSRKKSAAERIFRMHDTNTDKAELDRFESADPFRWVAIAKTDIQTGVMALVRAIAQPGS